MAMTGFGRAVRWLPGRGAWPRQGFLSGLLTLVALVLSVMVAPPASADEPAPTGNDEAAPTITGSGPERAADALPAPQTISIPTDQGFTAKLWGGRYLVENADRYEVVLVDLGNGQNPEALRAPMLDAISHINATGHVALTVADGVSTSKAPGGNQIVAWIDKGTLGCTGSYAGCGSSAMFSRPDGQWGTDAGSVEITPNAMTYNDKSRRRVIVHELLHAMGLAHHDDQYQGSDQIMHSASYATDVPLAGDINGLAFLASNRTDPYVVGAVDPMAWNDSTQKVNVTGWALDFRTAGASTIDVTVDGQVVHSGTASQYRADVDPQYGKGLWHGYQATVSLAPGSHEVCVIGRGARSAADDRSLGCETVYAWPQLGGTTVGVWESVEVVDSQLRVTGWAVSPASESPINTYYLWVGDTMETGPSTIRVSRPDVAERYGTTFPAGFDFTVDVGYAAGRGPTEVCFHTMGKRVPGGESIPGVALGCRTIDL